MISSDFNKISAVIVLGITPGIYPGVLLEMHLGISSKITQWIYLETSLEVSSEITNGILSRIPVEFHLLIPRVPRISQA